MGDSFEIEVDDSTVGVALLVSNDYQSLKGATCLSSVHQDTDKLEELFKQYGYAVYKRKNLSYREFGEYCSKMSDFIYPSTCERLLVYFSGHGANEILQTQDGKKVHISEIISMFKPRFGCKNENIGLIAKLFFFDSCRGGEDDEGCAIRITAKKSPNEYEKTIPVEGNILVAYACTPGYSAYSSSTGSRWTNCLIEALKGSKETDSLEAVLTKANGLLSEIYEFNSFQTATYTSSLRGSAVFFKKEARDRAKKGSGEFVMTYYC